MEGKVEVDKVTQPLPPNEESIKHEEAAHRRDDW